MQSQSYPVESHLVLKDSHLDSTLAKPGQKLSQEVSMDLVIPTMTMRVKYSKQDFLKNERKIFVRVKSKRHVRRAQFFIFVENCDGAFRFSGYCLTGQSCNAVGVINWDWTASDESSIVENLKFTRTFVVDIKERDIAEYPGFVNSFHEMGYTGLWMAPDPQQWQMPMALKLRLLCRYQLTDSGEANWHWVETASEAFLYKQPLVLEARPTDVKILNDIPTDLNGLNIVELQLDRPLIDRLDQLDKVTLSREDNLPFSLKMESFQTNGSQIRLDLRSLANRPDWWNGGERFVSIVRIHGNTDGVDWLPLNKQPLLAVQRIAEGALPPSAPPIGKMERAARDYDLDDSLN